MLISYAWSSVYRAAQSAVFAHYCRTQPHSIGGFRALCSRGSLIFKWWSSPMLSIICTGPLLNRRFSRTIVAPSLAQSAVFAHFCFMVVFALVSAISRALVVLLLQAMPSPQRQVRIWCIVASKELRMDQLDVVIKTACIALPAWGPVFPCFFPVFCGSGWVVGAGCFVWGLFKKKTWTF